MKKKALLSILLCGALYLMLTHSALVTDGVRYGLLLWYNSVVPTLFPFMVLSGMMVSFGCVQVCMEPVYRILHPFLPISKYGCYVLISGLLCGYPMGAKTCADFVRNEKISPDEGKFLMSICNHPSPMFLLGFAYPICASNVSTGEFLLCIYSPILILSLFAKKQYLKNTMDGFDHDFKHISSTCGLDETILSSITILCKIGGYLVLFSIMIVLLKQCTWLPKEVRLYLIGTLEMTTGIRELAASLPSDQAFICSIFSLCFGGWSGIFQTKAVISETEKKAGLSIRPYIFWKLLHAAIAAGIAVLICNF